jgi:hypothetical protein
MTNHLTGALLPTLRLYVQSPIGHRIRKDHTAVAFAQNRSTEALSNKYFGGGSQLFNLHEFWADHKKSLPLHFGAYVAEVGCKKAAAANVESVFFLPERAGTSSRRRPHECSAHLASAHD